LAGFPGKCFPEKFGRKTLSGSCEKIQNVKLFVIYIKFGPQTFDCYIYCHNLIFDHFYFNYYYYFIYWKEKNDEKIIMLEKQVNEEWIKIWVKGKMIGSFFGLIKLWN